MSQVWLNGTLTDKADARVSPFDHGFLYGDGVWEPLRVFGGKLFRANDHLRILFDAAQALGIDIPLSQGELLAAIEATVKANNRTEGYVRVIITRGPGTIGPDPRKIEPQVIVIAEEYQPFPQELYGHGLHAVLVGVLDVDNNIVHCYRTLNQLHVVQAKRYAFQNGCLEALFRKRDRNLYGSTEGMLFVVKDGTVGVACPQLADATADAVIAVAEEMGFTVVNTSPEPDDLLAADEAFIAGTACGVIGIVRLDGEDIGTGTEGPVTQKIREGYRQLIERESR